MLELKNAHEKRMKDIIGTYAQESGDDGWVLNTKELQDIYNNGLPKSEQIDIITAYNLPGNRPWGSHQSKWNEKSCYLPRIRERD